MFGSRTSCGPLRTNSFNARSFELLLETGAWPGVPRRFKKAMNRPPERTGGSEINFYLLFNAGFFPKPSQLWAIHLAEGTPHSGQCTYLPDTVSTRGRTNTSHVHLSTVNSSVINRPATKHSEDPPPQRGLTWWYPVPLVLLKTLKCVDPALQSSWHHSEFDRAVAWICGEHRIFNLL